MTSSPEAGSRALRRLLPFVLACRRDVALSVGAALAGSLLFGLVPVAQKVIVDGGIVHHDRAIWPWLVGLVLIGFVTFGLAFVRRWFGGRVSLSVQHQLRTAIFDRLMRLDFAGHDQLRTGQLVSRASSDLGLIQQLLAFLPIMMGNVVFVVVAIVAMAVLSPVLALYRYISPCGADVLLPAASTTLPSGDTANALFHVPPVRNGISVATPVACCISGTRSATRCSP